MSFPENTQFNSIQLTFKRLENLTAKWVSYHFHSENYICIQPNWNLRQNELFTIVSLTLKWYLFQFSDELQEEEEA